MREIFNLHDESQIGQQRKQVIDSEKHIISELEASISDFCCLTT
jgi:hypothetical protein